MDKPPGRSAVGSRQKTGRSLIFLHAMQEGGHLRPFFASFRSAFLISVMIFFRAWAWN